MKLVGDSRHMGIAGTLRVFLMARQERRHMEVVLVDQWRPLFLLSLTSAT